MISSIKIEGFKGIKIGTMDDVAQLNFITGKNNMGKSAFLESLYLFNSNPDVKLIRNFDTKEMFWSYNINNTLKYELRFESSLYHFLYSRSSKKFLNDIRDYLPRLDVQIDTTQMEKLRCWYTVDSNYTQLFNDKGDGCMNLTDKDAKAIGNIIEENNC